jgi:hypothetical protein
MEKEQVDVLPAASVARNALMVIPTGNAAPVERPAVGWAVAAQLSVVVTV